MDDDRGDFGDGLDESRTDIDEGTHIGLLNAETFEDRAEIERRQRQHGHQHPHIDLSAEEYTPEEVARLLGTSLDVVLHAARNGELKAQRAGHNIISIKHADVVEWLRSRGPGL